MTNIARETHDVRSYLANRYLSGNGIEVGALDAPFPIGENTRVQYVDRFRKAELLRHYPELESRADAIIDPDIVDDGEVLSTVENGAFDFLISSHFLEHCQNPLKTLRSHFRLLTDGGTILIAIPNSQHPQSWDFGRVLTSYEHCIIDDVQGPETSRRAHFMEWVTFAGKMSGEAAESECDRLMAMNYSIHFHCWTAETFLPFLVKSIEYNKMAASVVHYEAQEYEVLAVLKKG